VQTQLRHTEKQPTSWKLRVLGVISEVASFNCITCTYTFSVPQSGTCIPLQPLLLIWDLQTWQNRTEHTISSACGHYVFMNAYIFILSTYMKTCFACWHHYVP